jgi:hypothetical protein
MDDGSFSYFSLLFALVQEGRNRALGGCAFYVRFQIALVLRHIEN